MDRDADRAAGALGSVERAGREALAEMRRLLGVLGDGGDLRELAPQPGLGGLMIWWHGPRRPGSDLNRGSGIAHARLPGLGLCVYRVVQEALTNTIKHASATRATVAVRWSPEALELEVCDNGGVQEWSQRDPLLRADAVTPLSDTGGHGITGMRERTALHGGMVEAGRASSGGFVVRARIPIQEQQPA